MHEPLCLLRPLFGSLSFLSFGEDTRREDGGKKLTEFGRGLEKGKMSEKPRGRLLLLHISPCCRTSNDIEIVDGETAMALCGLVVPCWSMSWRLEIKGRPHYFHCGFNFHNITLISFKVS